MRNLFLCICLFASWHCSLSQNINSETNFIVGLPKVSAVQLQLLKTDLLDLPQILNAEYIFKEHCLLIESDFKTSEPMKYEHLEKVLLKYFAPDDIYKKETSTFYELRNENVKSDKFIIKTTTY